jgi:hypothetical protein
VEIDLQKILNIMNLQKESQPDAKGGRKSEIDFLEELEANNITKSESELM